MASSKAYLEYVLEQLSGIPEIKHRAMMGEYIIYYQGKVIGGVYDDRFLVKPTAGALAMMPDAPEELPYPSAKLSPGGKHAPDHLPAGKENACR